MSTKKKKRKKQKKEKRDSDSDSEEDGLDPESQKLNYLDEMDQMFDNQYQEYLIATKRSKVGS